MEYITLDNSQYLMYESLKVIAPIFCKGTRNGNELKDKRNLTMNTHFIFGKLLKKTGWEKSEGTSRRCDKVLFTKSFVDSLDEVKNGSTSSEEQKEIETPEHSFEISERLQKELTFSYAPNIITLSNNEKFQGPNGVPLEIETRGERTHDKIYFLVRDVMKIFGMNYLNDVIIKKDKDGYQEDIHYTYFLCRRPGAIGVNTNKTLIKRELFLTYEGFSRLISVNHDMSLKTRIVAQKWLSQNFDHGFMDDFIVDNIQDKVVSKAGYVYCVTSPLIHHIKIGYWRGNLDGLISRYVTYYGKEITLQYVRTADAPALEKMCHDNFKQCCLSNELFEAEKLDDYIAFLNENKTEVNEKEPPEIKIMDISQVSKGFSIFYLFSLGLVKDLRSSMNISSQHSDESVVCKYGFTKDLTRRTGEHLSSYKKIKGVELRLKHHVYIDPQYVSSAEKKISNYMKALQLGFEYADEKELVVISPSLTDLVSEQYQQIGRSYMGHITEFVSKVKDLEQRIELQELRHEKELVQKNMECELLKKELEIAQLKYRLVCKE